VLFTSGGDQWLTRAASAFVLSRRP
jgi:hypothetical protein